jgi:hypothetical protein
MTFDTRLSNLEDPSYHLYSSFSSDFKNEHSYEEYRSQWLTIKVFYSSLSYTTMYEMPKVSLTDLLAQIGGSLGMFVSFSVFSFFELIEIVILLICALIRN